MSGHNGHLVEPTDDDRKIIEDMLESNKTILGMYEAWFTWINGAHLFLETEMVNLKWIHAHLTEVEKELNRLKERVRDDRQDLSNK